MENSRLLNYGKVSSPQYLHIIEGDTPRHMIGGISRSSLLPIKNRKPALKPSITATEGRMILFPLSFNDNSWSNLNSPSGRELPYNFWGSILSVLSDRITREENRSASFRLSELQLQIFCVYFENITKHQFQLRFKDYTSTVTDYI